LQQEERLEALVSSVSPEYLKENRIVALLILFFIFYLLSVLFFNERKREGIKL
jgi:hypothetical protein